MLPNGLSNAFVNFHKDVHLAGNSSTHDCHCAVTIVLSVKNKNNVEVCSHISGVEFVDDPEAPQPGPTATPDSNVITGVRGSGALFCGRYIWHRSKVDPEVSVIKVCLFCYIKTILKK